LGCSRSRIARIEAGHGAYTLAELEVLALRFGVDPLIFLELTGPERALLDYAYANAVSHPALGPVIKCVLPTAGAVKRPIHPLAWSPDSRFLAAPVTPRGDDDAAILCIWEAAGGRLEAEFHLDDDVSALAFSPDGRLMAVAGAMDTVDIWDWRQRRVTAGLDPVDSGVYAEDGMWDFVHTAGYGLITHLKFSPDGRILAVGNEDHGTIRLWRVEDWSKLRTLSVSAMATQVEVEQARFNLGSGWKIDRDEAEEEFLYGSSTAPFVFTPDSRLLAVIFNRRLSFFNLAGRYGWSLPFDRNVACLDTIGLSQDGRMALLAAGGEEYLFEVWYQAGAYEQEFIYSTLEQPPLAASTIKQVRIINADCVLGLVIRGATIDNRSPFILNLVSNQPVPLREVDASTLIGDDDVLLAPDGRAVAYQDAARQLRIQRLELEHLISKDKSTALQIRFHRPDTSTPAHLRHFFEPEESEEAEDQATMAPEGVFPVYDAAPPQRQPKEMTPVDEVVIWLINLLSTRALQKERFGLAALPPEDAATIGTFIEIIQGRLSIDQVRLVELPARGPRVTERMLLGYLAGRQLDQAEPTEAVLAALKEQADLIIIDGAERLHYETMIGLCDHLQDLPARAFVLITRNEAAFIQEADKIRAGSGWLLSRAAVSHCLLRLSRSGPVAPEEAAAGGDVVDRILSEARAGDRSAVEIEPPLSRLETRLFYLKTATPAAQGGYGLAYLPRDDRTTVGTFVDRVRRQTSDRIVLVELAGQGPQARVRDIVQGVVGRRLAQGELTDPVLRREVQGQYNLIVIDRAESLHPDTMGWLCSHLRDIADAFLLVVRDEDRFKAEVIDKTTSPAWTLGRAYRVDLLDWLLD